MGLGLKVHGLGFRVFGFRVQGSSQTLKQRGGRGSGQARGGAGGAGGVGGGGGFSQPIHLRPEASADF